MGKTFHKLNQKKDLPSASMPTAIRDSQIGQKQNRSTAKIYKNQPPRKPNTKVSYKIMPGYRYNSKVLFCPEEQQFYLANTPSKVGMAYTCYVSDCKCRVHIQNNECYIVNAMAHNHEEKTWMYYNLCALNEIKGILRSSDNQLSPEEVFDDVIKRHPRCTLVFKEHERSLLLNQNGYIPKDGSTKKRKRVHSLSKSSGRPGEFESVAKKKKTKRSANSSNIVNQAAMNETFPDEDMQNIDLIHVATTELKLNDNTLVSPPQHSMPTHDQRDCDCECSKENLLSAKSIALESQTNNQLPQSPIVSNSDEYMCQIYVREEDLNRLIQTGHIFINKGRFHYK